MSVVETLEPAVEIDAADEHGVTEIDRAIVDDMPPAPTTAEIWQAGDDPELAPQGALLATQRLSRQLGLLPETCVLKLKASTIKVEGGEFGIGQHVKLEVDCVISGDHVDAKVESEGGTHRLQEGTKTQIATVCSAERVNG